MELPKDTDTLLAEWNVRWEDGGLQLAGWIKHVEGSLGEVVSLLLFV